MVAQKALFAGKYRSNLYFSPFGFVRKPTQQGDGLSMPIQLVREKHREGFQACQSVRMLDAQHLLLTIQSFSEEVFGFLQIAAFFPNAAKQFNGSQSIGVVLAEGLSLL